MESFIDVIFSRYSVREYTGEEIKEEDLELIVRAGMAAPTAVNTQPWSFIIVTDREILKRLCTELPYAKMLDKAAAAVIVCGIPDKNAQFSKDFWMIDCSAASENILLAVHALGYGAVWTAVYPEEDRIGSVRRICMIPHNVVPFNVIPVGVPVRRSPSPLDKTKKENIHRNTW